MDGRTIVSQPVVLCNAQHSGKAVHNREDSRLTAWWLLFMLSFLFLLSVYTNGAGAEQGEVLSGVLESVSLESRTVRLRNPIGQPIILKISNPHLLEHVTPGERITVVVNEEHEIIKLIETTIPELPPLTGQ